jgi:hypothetical protein
MKWLWCRGTFSEWHSRQSPVSMDIPPDGKLWNAPFYFLIKIAVPRRPRKVRNPSPGHNSPGVEGVDLNRYCEVVLADVIYSREY